MIQNSKGFRIEGGETERETHFQALKMTKSPKKGRFGILVALYKSCKKTHFQALKMVKSPVKKSVWDRRRPI